MFVLRSFERVLLLGLIRVDADDNDKVDARFALPNNCMQLSCLPFALSVGKIGKDRI